MAHRIVFNDAVSRIVVLLGCSFVSDHVNPDIVIVPDGIAGNLKSVNISVQHDRFACAERQFFNRIICDADILHGACAVKCDAVCVSFISRGFNVPDMVAVNVDMTA